MVDLMAHYDKDFMINWEAIWKIHSPYFKGGLAFVPLTETLSFPLKPGPGFGDLSHPTTQLVLESMKPLVKGKVVIDVGCGSGILSIAAALLGAKAVYAFEIDPDAISHAKENFKLNNLKILLNEKPPEIDIVCINMISSEQAFALNQYPFIKKFPCTLLSSGILAEEKERYLQAMKGWNLIKTSQNGHWLGFQLINY